MLSCTAWNNFSEIGGLGYLDDAGRHASKVIFKSEHVLKHLKVMPHITLTMRENAIRADLARRPLTKMFETRTIQVGGRTLEYRAHRLNDGSINVGTHFFR